MKTKRGTVIHTDGKICRQDFPVKNQLQALYAAIGGGCDMVEAPSVRVAGRQVDMWLDEDGLSNRQTPNLLATILWIESWGHGNGSIHGNVVIFGESIVKYFASKGVEIQEEDCDA